jgi:hypothetical protein
MLPSSFSWKDAVQRGMLLSSLPFIIALSYFVMTSFLVAAGVLIVQCVLWLSEGKWVGVSAAVFFTYSLPSSNFLVQWLDNPQSWYTAHKLITGTPLPVFLILIGVVSFYVFLVIGKWVSWLDTKAFS